MQQLAIAGYTIIDYFFYFATKTKNLKTKKRTKKQRKEKKKHDDNDRPHHHPIHNIRSPNTRRIRSIILSPFLR